MKKALKLVKDPLKVISEKKGEFLIWFLFTIFTGQFGILANIVVRSYSNDTPISHSILIDSLNGSFYTFAIALVASILGPIFINFIHSEKLPFRTLKTFTIIIAIFYLFIAAIIYAAVQAKDPEIYKLENASIDITQLVLYLIAILFAIYGYCILRLETSGHNFDEINDPIFNEKDDENVEETIKESREIQEDENGIEL